MIGKPEWFTYRIFGWGLRPKTKEGWYYIGAILILFIISTLLPLSQMTKAWLMGIIFTIFIIDVLHMMSQLHKTHDERQKLHQLVIERNCSFAAIAAIVGILVYQSYMKTPFDISLFIVLGIMLLTKIISTVYVNQKM